MKLFLTSKRFIALDTTLWDGEAVDEYICELPSTDETVRRDINALLSKHEQRELPPVKEKKTKAKKANKSKCITCDEETMDTGIELGKKVPLCKSCKAKEVISE